jgi:hypothetical protein
MPYILVLTFSAGCVKYDIESVSMKQSRDTSSSVTVTFPQADDNDCVFRYSIVMTDVELNEVVASASAFSFSYLNSDMPETITHSLSGLYSESQNKSAFCVRRATSKIALL